MRSDAELLVAARSDAGAFRELYGRYAARIYGYHLRRCQDPDAAHDLTAETFAQAWIARERFRDEAGGSAGPWLFGLDEAFAHLPDAQQDAIRLRVLDDLGYDEAAERLDTTPQAVRARVSRGLSALRKHFSTSTEMIR
jgi:DNA-directed RNA polymerase specialized sigma24 family protein